MNQPPIVVPREFAKGCGCGSCKAGRMLWLMRHPEAWTKKAAAEFGVHDTPKPWKSAHVYGLVSQFFATVWYPTSLGTVRLTVFRTTGQVARAWLPNAYAALEYRTQVKTSEFLNAAAGGSSPTAPEPQRED